MALYIRDNEVDVLARQVQDATNAPSKTEAVRIALQNELERARKAVPLEVRIGRIQDAVKTMGQEDPDFDMKAFTDELSGGI
jgi:antitoxin VapB